MCATIEIHEPINVFFRLKTILSRFLSEYKFCWTPSDRKEVKVVGLLSSSLLRLESAWICTKIQDLHTIHTHELHTLIRSLLPLHWSVPNKSNWKEYGGHVLFIHTVCRSWCGFRKPLPTYIAYVVDEALTYRMLAFSPRWSHKMQDGPVSELLLLVHFCSSSPHLHASGPFCFPFTLTHKLISVSLVTFNTTHPLSASTLQTPQTCPLASTAYMSPSIILSISSGPNMSKLGSQCPQTQISSFPKSFPSWKVIEARRLRSHHGLISLLQSHNLTTIKSWQLFLHSPELFILLCSTELILAQG